jgi:hypothetical protein
MEEYIVKIIEEHIQVQLDISQNADDAFIQANALQQLMAYMRIHRDIKDAIKEWPAICLAGEQAHLAAKKALKNK